MGNGLWFDGKSLNFSCIGIFFSDSKNYFEATAFCAELDSHLVEIFTEEQQEFLNEKIIDNFGSRNNMNFWIGLEFNGFNWVRIIYFLGCRSPSRHNMNLLICLLEGIPPLVHWYNSPV